MVTINSLANILPINGMTTGDLSDKLKNLFTPQGATFAIWGVIYSLLLVFTLRILLMPTLKSEYETQSISETPSIDYRTLFNFVEPGN